MSDRAAVGTPSRTGSCTAAIAFLRAIIQGLHAPPMWERYLAEEGEMEAEPDWWPASRRPG